MEPNNPGIQNNENINSNKTNGDEFLSVTNDEATAVNTIESVGPIPKFLIIKITKEGTTFENIPVHFLQKGLIGIASKVASIKKLKNGSILVETKSDKQSETLLRATKLAGFSIKVEPHKTLNSSRGVIMSYDLLGCSVEDIKSELSSVYATDVHEVTAETTEADETDETTKNTPIPVYIITFNSPTLPKLVKVAYMRLEVIPYIPKPLRCFNCQRFGHAKRSCLGKAVCVDCSQEAHGTDSCNSEKKCINCKGNHSASSVDCPKWKTEEATQQLRAMENISIREANKKYNLNLPKAST